MNNIISAILKQMCQKKKEKKKPRNKEEQKRLPPKGLPWVCLGPEGPPHAGIPHYLSTGNTEK